MANKKKPKRQQKLFTKRSNFNRFQVFTVVLVVVIGGLLTLQLSHAASGSIKIPVTYYWNSPSIKHSTGVHAVREERVGGNIKSGLQLWSWPKDSESAHEKDHYLQFGPYANITIPSPYEGLQVCYYYSAWNDYNNTDASVKVYVDLRFNGRQYNNDWTPDLPAPHQPETIKVTPLLYGYLPTIKSHCYHYDLVRSQGRYIYGVEFRIKAVGSNDKDATHVDLWKTTVRYWNDPSKIN